MTEKSQDGKTTPNPVVSSSSENQKKGTRKGATKKKKNLEACPPNDNVDEFTPQKYKINDTEKIPHATMADEYLIHCTKNNVRRVFWRGSYYVYHKGRYVEQDTQLIEISITKYLKGSEARDNLSKSYIKSVEAIYMATVSIHFDTEENSFYQGKNKGKKQAFISMENGILDLDAYLKGSSNPLLPHTTDFFTLTCLPYKFNAGAKSKLLDYYLETSVPDKQTQAFLQEWAGYNLTHETKMETVVMLQGEGSNGKSVYGHLLKMLLGDGNFSAVAPEDLGKDSKLLTLCGMRANICDDMNENQPINFGTLKLVVSGSDVTCDRKYKGSITFRPTAKHTLIGNSFLNVTDRSNGSIRRLIPIHFSTIIPKLKRDRRLVTQEHWQENGDIEGVFIWALEGLKRLREKEQWSEMDATKELIDEIKETSQPEILFFEEMLEAGEGEEFKVGTKQLHDAYTKWMGRSKAQMKQITLIKALNSHYGAKISIMKNPTTSPLWSGRQRVISGIKLHTETPILTNSPEVGKDLSSLRLNQVENLIESLQNEIKSTKSENMELRKNLEFLDSVMTSIAKKVGLTKKDIDELVSNDIDI